LRIIRYPGPVQAISRTALESYKIGDTQIREGDRLSLNLAAANRDPARFNNADRFEIERSEGRHVGFGFGIHFCLGASLARLEAKVGFEELFKRVRGLELLDEQPKHIDSFLLRGPQHLPLTQSDWA